MWTRRRWLLSGAGLLALFVLGGLAWRLLLQPAETAAPSIARVGAPAPQIALPTADGASANLQAEHGHVVLVNFWATWCEPCRTEMPGLQQLADELQSQPFRLYSVDLQEDPSQVLPFEQSLGLHLRVLLDQDGDVTRAYGVRALPSTFLIDQQGVLRLQRLGPLASGGAETQWSEAWLAEQVRSMLASG